MVPTRTYCTRLHQTRKGVPGESAVIRLGTHHKINSGQAFPQFQWAVECGPSPADPGQERGCPRAQTATNDRAVSAGQPTARSWTSRWIVVIRWWSCVPMSVMLGSIQGSVRVVAVRFCLDRHLLHGPVPRADCALPRSAPVLKKCVPCRSLKLRRLSGSISATHRTNHPSRLD